ncbi:nitrate- and nitrite sensing domain-containing protein [Sinosporangium album]|nr:nitrate- and nitrite sensing domain-containing protein [Sinosporangium album]
MLVSLAALWAFAAWVTLREGMNVLWVSTLNQGVSEPSERLVTELQRERRLTVVRLGAPSTQSRTALASQRRQTDAAMANFRELVTGSDVDFAATPALRTRIQETLGRLDDLPAGRKAVDRGATAGEQAHRDYTDTIRAFYRIYQSLGALDDVEVAKDISVLIEMSLGMELLSQQDALVAGFLSSGRFGDRERITYAQIVGAQRHHVSDAASDLPEFDHAQYAKFIQGSVYSRFRALEDSLLQGTATGLSAPVTLDQWTTAATAAVNELDRVVLSAGDRLVERTTPVVAGVIVRLVLAGGLGLIAVIASVILSVTTARALVAQLAKLRVSAWELANERLPGVVSRLGHGEEVDVAAEAPPLAFGTDEIGQVGEAFNAVQRTAIEVAVEQAELRRSIRDILLSLARRTQSLVHRQLTLLDAMERREGDPNELRDLFRVDHLATRMRRNAENLIVLSGSSPGRAWRRPVPMVDVVRGALAEVEDYTRVTVMPMGETKLVGRAVGDVIHLLAELVENAVAFSPPYTMVQVSGQMVSNGYAIEVEDRGLGMSSEDLAATNERIADPPEFNLSSTARLGLYVVSRLAERHHIRVSLKDSPYGGTTAVILLPREIVLEEGEDAGEEDASDSPVAVPRLEAAPGTGGSHPPVRIASVNGTSTLPDAGRRPALTAVPELQDRDRLEELLRDRPVERPLQDSTPPPPLPPQPARQEEPPPQTTDFTPSGLPFRVPQASLAPRLRTDGPLVDDHDGNADDADRSPDEIRKLMGAFQTGTLRGRSDAAMLLRGDADQASTPPPQQWPDASEPPREGGSTPPPSDGGSVP